jgi:hypothetical protein
MLVDDEPAVLAADLDALDAASGSAACGGALPATSAPIVQRRGAGG